MLEWVSFFLQHDKSKCKIDLVYLLLLSENARFLWGECREALLLDAAVIFCVVILLLSLDKQNIETTRTHMDFSSLSSNKKSPKFTNIKYTSSTCKVHQVRNVWTITKLSRWWEKVVNFLVQYLLRINVAFPVPLFHVSLNFSLWVIQHTCFLNKFVQFYQSGIVVYLAGEIHRENKSCQKNFWVSPQDIFSGANSVVSCAVFLGALLV